MMGRTHVVLGAASAAACAAAGICHADPITLAAGALGSLLPDIDHPKSSLGRRVPFLSIPLSLVVGHRGITHSLLALCACASLLLSASGSGFLSGYAAAAAVGYASHLAADAFTPFGIPLFWPHPARVRAPFTVKTNGAGETILAALVLVGLLASGPRLLAGRSADPIQAKAAAARPDPTAPPVEIQIRR